MIVDVLGNVLYSLGLRLKGGPSSTCFSMFAFGCGRAHCCPKDGFLLLWAQLFKADDVVSYRIVKSLIIKYGIYGNIFAEKM